MGRGRKIYRKKYNAIIVAMAEEGKSDIEISRSLGIGRSTLRDWYNQYQELALAVEDARELHVRTDVEAAMFKRAKGFKEVERVMTVDPKDTTQVLSLKVRERYFPPNVTAGTFLLTNKLSNEYKNRQSVEHSGKTGIKVYLGFTPEMWDEQFPDTSPPRQIGSSLDTIPVEHEEDSDS